MTLTRGLTALLVCLLNLGFQDPEPAPASDQEGPEKRLWPTKRLVEGDMVTLFFKSGHLHPVKPHGPGRPSDPGAGKWFAPVIEKFLDKTKNEWVEEYEHLHLLLVRVHKDNEKKITGVIESLDSPTPQVKLEVRVIEINWTKDQELGFEGGLTNFIFFEAVNPDALLREVAFNFRPRSLATTASGSTFRGSSFRFGALPSARQGTYNGILRAFIERGKASIRAQPELVVNSGAEAEFKAVDRVPIPKGNLTVSGTTQNFEFKEVGTTVKLHPHVIGNDQIDLEIDVELSTIQRFETFPVGGDLVSVPVIASRSSHSHLTIRSGKEVVISGIIRRQKEEFTRGVPYISDIPIVGALFRSTDKESIITEMVIIIKPTVYYLSRTDLPVLIDPREDD